jgi:FkbM family methyltransferase
VRWWLQAASAAVRHPRLMARLAFTFEHGLTTGIAEDIGEHFPPAEIRRLAFGLLGQERLQLICERDGFDWLVDTGDEIGEQIYVYGRYSGEEIAAILGWLEAQDKRTIVEVGANIGTTTLPFARSGYRVVAIEPVPSTFAMLQRNVEVNGYADRVHCVRSAVSVSPGDVEMWVTKGSGQSEVVSGDGKPAFALYGEGYEQAARRITVPSGRLDALLSADQVAIDDVALVWSDTQGYEANVIETGRGLWAAGVPLYVEVAPWMLERHSGGLDRFIACVEECFAGFVPREHLIGNRPPAEIGGFRAFVQSVRAPGQFSDALLVP